MVAGSSVLAALLLAYECWLSALIDKVLLVSGCLLGFILLV